MSNRRHILGAALLLLLGNLVSRLLGLIREQVIAAFFGISVAVSAFGTAARVPTMFYDLVIGGAVSAALVPVLSEYAESEDADGLGQVIGTLLVGAAMVLLVIVLLLLLAAVPLTDILLIQAKSNDHTITLAFVRIVTPALFFLGMSGVTAAVCYSRRWYAYPAVSIALYNAGLIATVVLTHRQLGPTSLVLGVVVGAMLQFVAVVPGLRGIPIHWGFNPRHPAVARIIRLYAPVAAGLVITEVGVIIDTNLAWGTGDQSVAIMRVATYLVQLPLGLVATGLSLAVLPILSRLVDDLPGFRHTLAIGLRLALLGIIPVTVFLVAFAVPVIRLLFQRGAFDATATSVTAAAFLLYAPQLPFVAVDQILVYAFYARKDTVTPMLVGLGGVGVYLASALTLIGPYHLGLSGLIIANTLQNSLHAVVLALLLGKSIGSLRGQGVGWTLARAVAAGLAAAGVAAAIRFAHPAPDSTLHLLLYLIACALAVVVTYVVLLLLFGVEEARLLPAFLRERVASRRTDRVVV
ncbi:MAG: murein biosynthesis integral membrane protein MurJ [Chloroflexota bacterium]